MKTSRLSISIRPRVRIAATVLVKEFNNPDKFVL